jgi:hypothetical protein
MKLRPVYILSTSYVVLAFAYSALGFLNGAPHENGSEYTIAFLIPEISGHILFAIIAILPFMDLELTLLSSVIAVFIDVDHLLGIFTTLPYIGRPDHSILFILVAASIFLYLSRRMNLSRSSQIKVAFVVPVAILSHLSFDVVAAYVTFGGGAFTFPIFYPFISTLTAFPLYSFVAFEVAAVALSIVGRMLVKKYGHPAKMLTPASKPKLSV